MPYRARVKVKPLHSASISFWVFLSSVLLDIKPFLTPYTVHTVQFTESTGLVVVISTMACYRKSDSAPAQPGTGHVTTSCCSSCKPVYTK